ncbi:sugar phosphate isomerase/epimerase family protein [Nocardioides sp. C4-1]|uniref:sugar phosphate isomerase/epimerase family protein n=1 Tax=Nocardioides sp. C4-1 TaxID=3151851 RepID=UPI003265BEDC
MSDDQARFGRRLGLSRRQTLAASMGLATAGAVGAATTIASPASAVPDRALVPPPRRGIILYTVRDVITRDPGTTDQPSGFREVLKYLSEVGYRQVEFAGYTQHANAPGGANLGTVQGARQLKRWLDNFGIVAQGNHGSVPSEITAASLADFDRTCEIATILGMKHVGTGGDPTGGSTKAEWDTAADRWNVLGERAMRNHGLKLYTHNHDGAYGFLLDSPDGAGAMTRSTGVRKLEYFLGVTDPKHVWLEMDVYWAHVAQFKHTDYVAPDGSEARNIFDPALLVSRHAQRYPLFHAKDGNNVPTADSGYDMVPLGQGDIDYQSFFRRVDKRNYANPMFEMDNGTYGNGSLDNARISIEAMAALRG